MTRVDSQDRARADGLSADVYGALVDSLFGSFVSLAAGAAGGTLAAALTAWDAESWSLLACAVAIAAVGAARVAIAVLYARSVAVGALQPQAVRCWERRYAVGATAYALLLGIWSFIGMATNEPVVHLICASVTIGYTAGISGRNAGRPLIVASQIVCGAGPLCLALLLRGDLLYAGLAFLLGLFFVSMRGVSLGLHQTLLRALVARREVAVLACRFDTALNNMSHGLCMFDSEHRVVVCNRRLLDLLDIPADAEPYGATVREFFLRSKLIGRVSASRAERLLSALQRRLALREDGVTTIELDMAAFALTFQAMDQGGSVVLIEDITERRKVEAKIAHMARYDALTGLPNRSFFREKLEHALAAARMRDLRCAVLCVDLDHFKQVNDTLGHPRGDLLLRVVADRLRKALPGSNVVARFGGDEFTILLPRLTAAEAEAETTAQRVIDVLSEPYDIEGHQVIIGASVGMALAPRDGTDPDQLLRSADMALYRAKAEGRSTWRFFEPSMDREAQARRTLERDLRQALKSGSFELYYQPLFNLKRHKIATCEALLRWPHAERGLISPGLFIPVAEEMGLIVELGEWVLRRACEEATRWPNDIRVAVNLSPIQFRRGNLVEIIKSALHDSGLQPDRLEIEITETLLLNDLELTRSILQQIRDLGIRISLDDFGTGYSSLSYLHTFPFHKVKIDRSFLQDLQASERSRILMRGITRLSAELGLSVVVEGVETDEQLALVTAGNNVDEVQGYLFSPPRPARELHSLLSALDPRQAGREPPSKVA